MGDDVGFEMVVNHCFEPNANGTVYVLLCCVLSSRCTLHNARIHDQTRADASTQRGPCVLQSELAFSSWRWTLRDGLNDKNGRHNARLREQKKKTPNTVTVSMVEDVYILDPNIYRYNALYLLSVSPASSSYRSSPFDGITLRFNNVCTKRNGIEAAAKCLRSPI